MVMKTEFLTTNITDVATWLNQDSEVQLPVVQRNFVWKASQIECLWDSIFRGYPIGTVMLSREGDKKMLLDGQQRTTAIALGFYNPWDENRQSIGNAKNLPIIWIDVAPRKLTEAQRYVFRVVTRSHPWGYQLQYPTKILSFNQRRRASEMYAQLFDKTVYTKLKPTERLPFDATCPIPLCFLLEAANKDDAKSWVLNKCKKNIPEGFRTTNMSDDETFFTLLEEVDWEKIVQITRNVVLQTMIPSIVLPEDLLIDKEDTSSDDSTLFVRLNSQGTKIEGEELMYSMFKAIYPESKNLVENIGINLIPPSRVITMMARLVLSKERYVANISLAQFRRYVQDDNFVRELKEIIGIESCSPIREKIESAIDILRYNNVPDVVVKKYIRDNPDGFLLLLHWLFENNSTTIDNRLKKEICARLYRNYWFGNINAFVSKNWAKVNEDGFWGDAFFVNEERISQHPLIKPSKLEQFLISKLESQEERHQLDKNYQLDLEIWEEWSSYLTRPEGLNDDDYNVRIQDGWQNFLWRLLSTRDKSLILLAQRDFINKTFSEFNQLDDLEDTTTPWDWDHIYPNSWVYRQQKIDDRTRLWEQRIGNFRAMSLTDNRSENNNLSPADRFDCPNMDYFIKENDLEYWKELNASHKHIKDFDKEYVLIHAKAIITRSVNIYANFLEMFFS